MSLANSDWDEADAFARAVADFPGVEALGDFRECERAGV